MSCDYCWKDAVYRCSVCGRLACAEHAKLRTVCPSCVSKQSLNYGISKVISEEEKEEIQRMVKRFWGEPEQLTFDQEFVVAELPAYIARSENEIIGFVAYTETEKAMLIVALGVLPEHQGTGVGRSLVEKVEAEAKKTGKNRLLVSTSNDDLPALAFYQSVGFQIYEVRPNVIAEKHGRVLKGIGGLPVRDELRLHRILR
jgi:ribosomal protein S18 acetylase RimI-like enzyme